jgi:hypothetical protein
LNWKALLVVLFAPLGGALVYAIPNGLILLPFGWLYGLVLTIVVGLPVGFSVSWLLRKWGSESELAYAVAGSVTAFAFSMLLPSRYEFWPAITATGLLLGIGYWRTVRAIAVTVTHRD